MVKAQKASMCIKLEFNSSREAKVVKHALAPEKYIPISTRYKVVIRRRENALFLKVDAEDVAALRAALNSFIRWAIVARDMLKPRRK